MTFFWITILLFFIQSCQTLPFFFNTSNVESYRLLTTLANVSQTIRLNGFDVEDHIVSTPDNYQIQIFRILNPARQTNRFGYPIIMFHGLSEDAHTFIMNTDGWFNRSTEIYVEYENNFQNKFEFKCPPRSLTNTSGRSIAFTLAVCGFDVWLANYRDNTVYSSHSTLNFTSGILLN